MNSCRPTSMETAMADIIDVRSWRAAMLAGPLSHSARPMASPARGNSALDHRRP
jgi:hypothetical protein